MEKLLKNPILPGFYPDPSICRVGEDYYMVTSTFEMFPGLPVFHSRDLANWEQLCYAADRPSQLHLTANAVAGGVMAPTIRYHDGVFYIINANFCGEGNYILTATDPAGPWSEPHWLPDVPGIDASLFFDDDGTAYVQGTGNVQKPDGTSGRGIYLKRFDIKSMKATSEAIPIWDCALHNASAPEAPHLYKKDGWYYLIIAEGGTEHYHAVTVARSRTIDGWYEGNPGNPVLTHRHLGFDYPIDNVGHADLVELPNGEWYAVMLGSRIIGGYHKNLGRESYITPVAWEREWPVFSYGTGKVEWSYPAPDLPWTEYPKESTRDDFDGESLGLAWNFWGTPYEDFWKLENSRLKLRCLPRPMARKLLSRVELEAKKAERGDNVAFVGRRQCHTHFTATAEMTFTPQKEGEAAGLVIMQASNHQYRLERCLADGKQVLRLLHVDTQMSGYPHLPTFQSTTTETVRKEVPVDSASIVLQLRVEEQDHRLLYGPDEEHLTEIGCVDGRLLNPEIVGGMVGTYIGMYATANGKESDNWASFDWFDYLPGE